jgi:hypothetical protein
MRYLNSLFAAGSGFAVATTLLMSFQAVAVATPAEIKGTQIAAVERESQPTAVSPDQTKVVCSRNKPLSLNAEGVKVASGIAPQSADWGPNVIRLFCRDVRINTIVVRDYCAVIRN